MPFAAESANDVGHTMAAVERCPANVHVVATEGCAMKATNFGAVMD